jgi:Transmembrane protein 43
MAGGFSSSVTTSYGSRIGQSIVGALFGMVLFLIAFPLLFWNEGRAVRDAKRLDEGSKAVISVLPDKVDPANDGKEVCVAGDAQTADMLGDPAFGVTANALALHRDVQMYQWKETSKHENQTGGGTVTTYTYEKTWSLTKINSSGFNKHTTPSGDPMHNPTNWRFDEQTWRARNVTLGAFKLSGDLIEQISARDALLPGEGVTPASGPAADSPDMAHAKFKVSGDSYYVGVDPVNPQIGDMLVSFEVTKPQALSVVARQAGNSFVPYPTKSGGTIAMLRLGNHTAAEMFKMAKADAVMLTWILRGVGFILMAIGIGLTFKPLTMMVAFLPFLEGIADGGVAIVAFLGALVLSLGTISIAWLFYRPIMGIGLLALAASGLFLLVKARRGKAVPAA